MSEAPPFVWDGDEHRADVVSGRCEACWSYYADRCECGVGWKHNTFEDESWDSVHLRYRCDACGSESPP